MKYRVIHRRGGTWLRRAHCACEMRVADERFEPCFPHFGAGLKDSLRYLRRALAEYRRAR